MTACEVTRRDGASSAHAADLQHSPASGCYCKCKDICPFTEQHADIYILQWTSKDEQQSGRHG